MAARRRVAILGGGLAALTTAYELSATDALRREYEVTLYQLGWRLGGKCATGRGANARVQEHGIHLFGGGYYNALPMMKSVYAAWQQECGGPLAFTDAFEPQFTSLRFDDSVQPMRKIATKLPKSPIPLDRVDELASVEGALWHVPRVLRAMLAEAAADAGPIGREIARFVQGLEGLQGHLEKGAFVLAEAVVKGLMLLLDGLKAMAEAVSPRPSGGLILANFMLALLAGTLRDRLAPGGSYNAMDTQNWDAWLRNHGAWAATVVSPVALAPLRILYAWPEGDSSRTASMGAGAYLHWTLRTLAYAEAPFWFFREGTGETVIKPLYQLLLERGVRFEFFHRVEALRLDPAGGAIEAVDIAVQARALPELTTYNPLDDAGHWPAAPNFAQLADADALRALPPGALEDEGSTWKTGARKLLRGQDFDTCVFAISIGAVPRVGAELLAASAAWRRMVDAIPVIETQHLQMWLSKTSQELGIDEDLVGGPIDAPHDTGLGCGFAAPYDGVSDFTLLLDATETWPAPQPKALWYFSDMMRPAAPGAPTDAAQRHADALAHAVAFVNEKLPALLPEVVDATTGRFDWRLLVNAAPLPPNPTDAQRLDGQWVRANVQPTDRYVQAPCNTTRHRLQADRSGFAGLVLAGDWTYNGLNVGCVEAAVMSGKLAANTITGRPTGQGVLGWHPPP